MTNSKGVAKIDDEGRAVGHTSNKKRIGATMGGVALGAILWGVTNGAGGALAGGAPGGVAAFVLTSTISTAGTDIQFLPGSIFVLEVSDMRSNKP